MFRSFIVKFRFRNRLYNRILYNSWEILQSVTQVKDTPRHNQQGTVSRPLSLRLPIRPRKRKPIVNIYKKAPLEGRFQWRRKLDTCLLLWRYAKTNYINSGTGSRVDRRTSVQQQATPPVTIIQLRFVYSDVYLQFALIRQMTVRVVVRTAGYCDQ